MKVFLFFFLFTFTFFACYPSKETYSFNNIKEEGYIPFQMNDKWGFLDENCKILIEPRFDSVGFFYNGISKIKSGVKYGLLKLNGDYLVEPVLSAADEFFHNYSQITKDKLVEYIDSKGNELEKKPSHGIFCWGTIDKMYKGQISKINDKFEMVYERRAKNKGSYVMTYDTTSLRADTIIDFSNTHIQIVKDGKVGIMEFDYDNFVAMNADNLVLKYDSIVIPKHYEGAVKFAKVKSNGLWGILDDKGKELVQPKYFEIITNPFEIRHPIAITSKRIYQNHKKLLVQYEKGKMGYIDLYGKEYFNDCP